MKETRAFLEKKGIPVGDLYNLPTEISDDCIIVELMQYT